MFPPPNLLDSDVGQLLLITDTLPAPADFLLHQILSTHLRSRPGDVDARCVIGSVSEDFGRWKAVAGKSNLNLSNHDSIDFLDISDILQSPSQSNAHASLRPIFDRILTALTVRKDTPLVRNMLILDDVASLEWIGFSSTEIARFCRALKALCLKNSASLVIRHHIVTPTDPDDILRCLTQLCDYHLDVQPLSSGKSGAVSGEVALHAGPSVGLPKVSLLPRSAAMQYRLTDTGAVFFERGTGGGVL